MQKVFKHSLANGDGVKLLKNAENCLKQGLVYGAQCRYHEANEYLNKSVKLFKRHGKPAPVKLRNAYNAIGILQFTKGKISQAQISLEYALGLCEVDSKNGYGHDGFLDIGGLLNDSAIILAKRGDMEQAKMNLNSVLEMAMKGHTPSSALVGATNANLGELYCQMGDTILAEKHLRVATSWLSLNAQENEMMRLDTAAVAAVHASLGRMCLVNGHTCEARHLLEGALNKCVGLERNPVHGKCAANLALFHLYNHNAASALALLRIARTSLRNSMGLNHIDMVACLNNLATVTDLKEATTLLDRCISMVNKLDKGDPKIEQHCTAVKYNQATLTRIRKEVADKNFGPRNMMEALKVGYASSTIPSKSNKQYRKLKLLQHPNHIMGVGMAHRTIGKTK